MKTFTACIFLLVVAGLPTVPPAYAQSYFSHLTDGIRHDLPVDLDYSMATATLILRQRSGGPDVVWNVGSVPTEGPISTRRRTITPATAAAAGVNWALAEQYFLQDAPTDLIERVTIGPLVAQLTWPTWGSDPQYKLFPPNTTLDEIRFELTGMGTNLNAQGLRSLYVGGTFRYAITIPEPTSAVLLLLALCGIGRIRRN